MRDADPAPSPADTRHRRAPALAGAAASLFALALIDPTHDATTRLWLSRVAVGVAVASGLDAAWQRRRTVMHRLAAFLLAPDDPLNLAWTRFVVFGVIATRISVAHIAAFAQLPAEIVRVPVGMGWAQPWIPRSPDAIAALGWTMRVAAAAAALGAATRLTSWIAAITACVLLVIPHMFGHVGHDRHHLVWFALLLAASPCGDRLGVDAAVRAFRRRGAARDSTSSAPAPRYGFPRRSMLLVMGVAYFFAGFWKLAAAGVDWFRSDSLALLAAKLAWAGIANPTLHAAAHPLLVRAAALGVVCFEIGFVFAIFSRLGRKLAIGAAFAFHTVASALLGISFGTLLYCYVGLADVAGWLRRMGALTAGPTSAASNTAFPSRVAYATATLVIGGNLLFGALRIGDGWPFACYPRFDVLQSSLFTSYVLEGETTSGTRVRLQDAELGGAFGPHFYNLFRANQARGGGLEDVDGREPRWRALCTFAWSHDPRLRGAHDVRFVLEDIDVAADAGRGRVLGRRVVFTCDR